MAAKMAAKNLILMYLSSAFTNKNKWIVYSYEVKDVQFKYDEINNNCIISKMAVQMVAENLILVYLIFAFRYKDNRSIPKMLRV